MSTQKNRLLRVLHSMSLWRKPQDQVEESMSGEGQAIRDFIYLDIPRLESILAQLQRGLVRGLVETRGGEASIEAELGGGLPWLQARLTGRGGISGERQVSKVLHDYLCSLVEEGLGERIRDIGAFSVDDWRTGRVHQELGKKQMDFIRVSGRVKITDFMGLAVQLESMGRLMRVFQQFSSPEQSMRQPRPRSKKRRGKGQGSTTPSQDDEMIIQVVSLIKEFYGDLIVLKVFPVPDEDHYYFIGPLSQEGLQDERVHMLLKFGTATSVPWTVLAQVASVPSQPQTIAALPNDALPAFSPGQFTDMSDAIEQLMDAIAQLFAVTGMTMTVKYPAIAITPLAVYRA